MKDSCKRWGNIECEILRREDTRKENYHKGEGKDIMIG